MRRIYFLSLAIFFIASQFLTGAFAQNFPSTGTGLSPCTFNCGNWQFVSNQTHAGGSYQWIDGPLPAPPSGNLGANGQMLFASTFDSPTIEGGLSVQMTGLIPGKKYSL